MRELEDFAVAELESGMPVVTQKCLHHLSVSFAAALQEKVSELTMPAPPPARSSIGFLQVSQRDSALSEPVACIQSLCRDVLLAKHLQVGVEVLPSTQKFPLPSAMIDAGILCHAGYFLQLHASNDVRTCRSVATVPFLHSFFTKEQHQVLSMWQCVKRSCGKPR